MSANLEREHLGGRVVANQLERKGHTTTSDAGSEHGANCWNLVPPEGVVNSRSGHTEARRSSPTGLAALQFGISQTLRRSRPDNLIPLTDIPPMSLAT